MINQAGNRTTITLICTKNSFQLQNGKNWSSTPYGRWFFPNWGRIEFQKRETTSAESQWMKLQQDWQSIRLYNMWILFSLILIVNCDWNLSFFLLCSSVVMQGVESMWKQFFTHWSKILHWRAGHIKSLGFILHFALTNLGKREATSNLEVI